MIIKTKHFGEVEVDKEQILHFENGLFGFEDEKDFVLLEFSKNDEFLLSLQSANNEYLAFSVINPFMLMPDYKPQLNDENLEYMGVEKSEELCFYNMCTIKKPVSQSTINLRCPIVINDRTRKASQIILDDYDMRVPLSELEKRDK